MRNPLLVRLVVVTGLVVVALGALLLTGTNGRIFTLNDPISGKAEAAPVTAPTTTSSLLPPRPRELPLNRVDPCTILTSAQRQDLSLDGAPTGYLDTQFDKARACSIRGIESGTVARLALVTTMGVDVWLSDEAQVQAKPVLIGDFPALVVRTPGLDDACNVEVDTANNQFMDVMFRDGGNTPPIPQDTLCAGAQRVAEAAMASLAGAS
jgi:hypothetical protein